MKKARETLVLFKGLAKGIIAIIWISGSAQAPIIVVKLDNWKKNEYKLVKHTNCYVYHKILDHALKT